MHPGPVSSRGRVSVYINIRRAQNVGSRIFLISSTSVLAFSMSPSRHANTPERDLKTCLWACTRAFLVTQGEASKNESPISIKIAMSNQTRSDLCTQFKLCMLKLWFGEHGLEVFDWAHMAGNLVSRLTLAATKQVEAHYPLFSCLTGEAGNAEVVTAQA